MTVEVQDNRFVSQFILPQWPNFQRLNEVADEIAFERSSWQNSAAAEEYTDAWIKLLNRFGVPHKLDSPQGYTQYLLAIRNTIYGEVAGPKTALNLYEQQFKRLPHHIQTPINELLNVLTDHKKEFISALKPLTNQREIIAQGLIDGWQEFMIHHPAGFADFAQFLKIEEFEPLRGKARPFLEALQTQSDKLVPATTKGLVENTLSALPSELFAEFLGSLSGDNPRNRHHQLTLQWLRLASFPSLNVNPEAIIQKIKAGAPFPDDLKNLFAEFLQGRINTDVRNVRPYLAAFKPTRLPLAILDINTFQIARKPGKRVMTTQVIPKTEGEIQIEPEKPTYQLALSGRGIPTEEELERFIEKTANSFASHDQRMRNDIEAMVKSLTQDPFRLGVAKLTDAEITSEDGQRKLPLRRFRPDQRIPLDHEESTRLRLVYYLDRRDPHTVFLHEIFHHTKFDAKYT